MAPAKIIAVAGAGDLAKYAVEAAIANGNVKVAVISRKKNAWFDQISPNVSIHITDYSTSSIQEILDATGATALFSLIHSFDADVYLRTHRAMLDAVKLSLTCKRFSPSYFGGNIDKHPGYPRVYKDIHQAFHNEMIEAADGIQWTVINQGWIMDYIAIFVEAGKYGERSHMKSQQVIWPIDMKNWTAAIPGTGDEPATFTSAADVGRAIIALGLTSEPWEHHTYVQGEQTTWNQLVKQLEVFYDRKFKEITHQSLGEIRAALELPANQDNLALLALLQTSEWTALGGQGLPQNIVDAQRQRFFPDIQFTSVEGFLAASKEERV